MIGVAKPLGCVKQALQELLAFEKRGLAKVVSIAVEKIEGEVNYANLRDKAFAGSAHMHAFLQAFEVAVALAIQSDDLSVKNCLASGQGLGKRRQLGIAFGDVNASTRAKHQSAILNPRQRADTVPFDLKEPVAIGKGAVGKRRKHGFHARRHRALASALHLSRLNRGWPAFRRQYSFNLLPIASRKGETFLRVA